MTKGRKERNDEKLTNQRGCKQRAAGQREGKKTVAETDKEHKTVNGINAAAQKKGEQKRMNKRVRELTKETVGVSDSSECGENMKWTETEHERVAAT